MLVKNELGHRYGHLLVIASADTARRRFGSWMCRCDCGKTKEVTGARLHAGSVKSCGCSAHPKLHDGAGSSEYRCWINMKQRCYNPKDLSYPDYGGRGITVFPGWKNNFVSFLKAVGKKPGPSYSLDRINVNGHYAPGNVRWATTKEQLNNRRTKKIEHFSDEDIKKEFIRRKLHV